MHAVVLNCTLKPFPQPSHTALLAQVVVEELERLCVSVDVVRVVDQLVPPGIGTDLGDADDWPRLHDQLLRSAILVLASPTQLGRPSSIAQRVLERMDAMRGETDDAGRPVAYNRVAGVVVTAQEDGAQHVISEIAGALVGLGYTVPGQGWTYWNGGPGPGPSYADTDDGHAWSERTGRTMARNLHAVAQAMAGAPMSAPPSR